MHLKILIILLLTTSLFAQEDYVTYDMDAIPGKEYDIRISKTKGEISFYLSGMTADKNTKRAGFMITGEKEAGHFRDLLIKAKEKFIEWKAIAIENEVTDMKKYIDHKSKKVGAYWLDYDKYRFDNIVLPRAKFSVFERNSGIAYMVFIQSDELVSERNKYIKDKGVYVVLSSPEEFDEMIGYIDVAKAEAKLNEPSKSDLFKN